MPVGNFPAIGTLYFQASIESAALLDAGYNDDSHWNALSMGLLPIGLTSSLAARPRNFMKAVECQEWRIDNAKSFVFRSAVICSHTSFRGSVLGLTR